MNKIEVVNLSHFYQDGMQLKKVLDNLKVVNFIQYLDKVVQVRQHFYHFFLDLIL